MDMLRKTRSQSSREQVLPMVLHSRSAKSPLWESNSDANQVLGTRQPSPPTTEVLFLGTHELSNPSLEAMPHGKAFWSHQQGERERQTLRTRFNTHPHASESQNARCNLAQEDKH
jgi:hypothetical protein